MQKVIIRLSFRKDSTEISAGLTRKNNITLSGTIDYSDSLAVSYLNNFVDLKGEVAKGKLGTLCFKNHEKANEVINQVNTIQAKRHSENSRFPFVWLTVMTEGTPIFNEGMGGAVDRVTFLEIETVEVSRVAPPEVLSIKPTVSSSPQEAMRANSYGTTRYNPQTKVAIASANVANNSAPSFNTNVIEAKPVEVESQNSDSQDSQQDKLNAIAVAMKAAGMSSAEIAQALKEEMSLV